jgi:hypothetical protein
MFQLYCRNRFTGRVEDEVADTLGQFLYID